MLHQIGIGTLGPVFRTYEPSRDRLVAVKVFRLDIVPEQSQALAEALDRAVHASLFHPSIVEPIGAGVEGTVAYRAEEYVAAESLDVAMRHYAPAPIEKVLPFITQLAGAIDFARAAGVGHGGLHPRDIFVTPDEARATGFGVVEALEQIGVRAPVRRPYTAPERIDGQAWGTAADIFSLAAITFELLTGRRPAGTGAQIGALPDGDHSAAVHAVLARAMDDDPGRRYGSALAFAAALESASRGESESATISEVAAIAATARVAAAAPVAERGPAEPVPAAAPAAAAARTPGPPAVPTPGEFEIERRLEPPGAPAGEIPLSPPLPAQAAEPKALEAAAPASAEAPTLFEPETGDGPVHAGHEESPPFADEFADGDREDDLEYEQSAAGEDRRSIEPFDVTPEEAVIQEHEPQYAAEEPAPPHDLGIDAHEPRLEVPERGHPGVLPMALVGLLTLLVGFGLGYFVRGQNHPAAEPQTGAAPGPTGSAPAGTAPAARAYSDQKVSPAPPQGGAAAGSAARSTTPPAEAPPELTEAPLSTPATSAAARPPATRTEAPAPRTEAPATRGERAARVGELVVRSTPEHAGVTVNGNWRGRTPLALHDLPFGRYVVRVVQPGYRVAREEFSLGAGDAAHTVIARLEKLEPAATHEAAPPGPPEVFTGTLFVDSRPQGATVLLDGRSIGRTPLTLPDVRIGMHVVRIEMAGKKDWSSTARIVAGETARVTGSLEDR